MALTTDSSPQTPRPVRHRCAPVPMTFDYGCRVCWRTIEPGELACESTQTYQEIVHTACHERHLQGHPLGHSPSDRDDSLIADRIAHHQSDRRRCALCQHEAQD